MKREMHLSMKMMSLGTTSKRKILMVHWTTKLLLPTVVWDTKRRVFHFINVQFVAKSSLRNHVNFHGMS